MNISNEFQESARKRRQATRMASYSAYRWIFLLLPPTLSAIITAIFTAAGWYFFQIKELLCNMFPYIEREQASFVAFGFILSKLTIKMLCIMMVGDVFCTMWVFWSNVLVQYSDGYNPYVAITHNSYEFDCFFINNDSVAELGSEKSLYSEEDITCFAINFNVGGAMGQATGTLAFAWVIVYCETWLALRVSHYIKKQSNEERYKYYMYLALLVIVALVVVVVFTSYGLVIYAMIHNSNRHRLYFSTSENALFFLNLFTKPENMLFFLNLIGTVFITVSSNKKIIEEETDNDIREQIEERDNDIREQIEERVNDTREQPQETEETDNNTTENDNQPYQGAHPHGVQP